MFSGFRQLIFDDNLGTNKEDSFSLRTACHLLTNIQSWSEARYGDNFGHHRELNTKDVKQIKTVFTKVIESYHEFTFPWRQNGSHGDAALFEEYDWSDIKRVYALKNPPNEEAAHAHQNIALVKLAKYQNSFSLYQ